MVMEATYGLQNFPGPLLTLMLLQSLMYVHARSPKAGRHYCHIHHARCLSDETKNARGVPHTNPLAICHRPALAHHNSHSTIISTSHIFAPQFQLCHLPSP